MMKLALRLGRTLGELKQTIGMSELRLWAAYDRISPIGDERGDFQAAQITAATYNAQGGRTRSALKMFCWAGVSRKTMTDQNLKRF